MDVPPPTPGAGAGRQCPLPPPVPPGRALLVAEYASRRKSLLMYLRQQGCEVTACSNPVAAAAMLRGCRVGFASVVVDMFPSRGGALKLLKCVIREMRLPAFAATKGGCLYGPLNVKVFHAYTSQVFNESKSPEVTPNGQRNGSVTAMVSTTTMTSSSGRRATRRRKRQLSESGSQQVEQDSEHGEKQQQPVQRPKKARLIWTDELHRKFVDAYNKLLPRDAVPKKIQKLMNDDTLTRENIASHLQKYRFTLKQSEPQSLTLHTVGDRSEQHQSIQRSTPVYKNYGFNTNTVIRAPTMSEMQNNHPKLHMNKECMVAMVHPRDESVRRCIIPKKIYVGAQVEHGLNVRPKLVNVGSQNNSDNNFQEDLSQIILQTLNKDPGPSWDLEFLHNIE